MKKRRMTRKGSKRLFRKTAMKVHKVNSAAPSRGGIRL